MADNELDSMIVTFGANYEQLTNAFSQVGTMFSDLSAAADNSSAMISDAITQSASSFSDLTESAEESASSITSSMDEASGGIGKFGGSFTDLFFQFQAAKGIVTGLFQGLLGPAMDAQTAMAQTTQALKSTHDASGETVVSITDLADSLSQLTPFTAETTQAAENMLLTFTNIGSSVFPQATQTVLDMSQALGQSATSSAMQLGKALNDPITGVSALQRVGVTFTDSQKAMIKSMVDTGNTAGAQKIILQELQKEFGGSAEAAGKTFPGQLAILGNSFHDLMKNVGDQVLPVFSKLVGFLSDDVMPGLQSLSGTVGQGAATAFKDIGNAVGPLLSDLAPVGGMIGNLTKNFSDLGKNKEVTSFLSSMQTGFKAVSGIVGGNLSADFQTFQSTAESLGKWWQSTMQPTLAQAMPSFSKLGSIIATDLVPAFARIWATGQQVSRELLPPLTKAFETVAPIVVKVGGFLADNLGKAIQFLTPYLTEATQAIGQFAGDIITKATPVVEGLWNMIQSGINAILPIWNAVWPSMQEVLGGVWKMISGTVQIAWSLVSGIIKTGLDLLSGNWKGAWNDIKGTFSGVWDGLNTIVDGAWTTIKGTVAGGINAVIGLINDFINGLDKMHINIPGVGNVGFSIPDIPLVHFATGGFLGAGQIGVAGEEGPELIFGGTSGVSVMNHAQSMAAMASAQQPAPIVHIHNYIDGQELTDIVGSRIVQRWLNHGTVKTLRGA